MDDVESGPGIWTTGGDGAATWQITEEQSHSPTHAWTEGAVPGADYVDNADNWIQTPVYDLSGYDSVMLSFWHIYDLETNWDFGLVEVSRDGGATWEQVDSYTGYGNWTWRQETLDLGLAHEPNARLRFRFKSDSNTAGRGWHIDDVTIYGDVRQCAQASPAWHKRIWISGDGPFLPADSPFRGLLTTDTVTIVDRVWVTHTNNVTFSLVERWSESLRLDDVTISGGSLAMGVNEVTWDVTAGAPSVWHVLTKTFGVVSGSWMADAITESLTVEHALLQPQDIVLQFRHSRFEIYLPIALKND
jgi:hypothetical protein